MNRDIDYEGLRRDLKDYYGTAMFAGFGAAMMDDLEEFYEAAGFDKFHDKVLKNMNEEEIEQMHNDVYKTISAEENQ